MRHLVLLRHGQSIWNRDNLFTGWEDVPLSERGIEEATAAGRVLREHGHAPDVGHTSVLKRAIKTLWIVLEETDRMWVPVKRSWRLNERHYGALQGLNKAETVARYGEEQVHAWRRSYATRPPPLAQPDSNPRYAGLEPGENPLGESLADTARRVLPCWEQDIVPDLADNRCVLIAAHGNSLRALIMHLDGLSEQEIADCEVPTGIPLIYELGDDLAPVKRS